MVYEPELNGLSFDMFKAHLLSYEIGACDYDNAYMMPPKSVFPVSLNGKIGMRSISLKIDFEGDNDEDITTNISNVIAMLQKKAELFLPDGFYYTCMFESSSTPKEVAPWIKQIKFTFSGVRRKAMKTEILESSGKIVVEGNTKTSAIFKIIPVDGTTEATINNITIKNIKNEVIIDGIGKKITENGVNKFKDSNLTEFPLLNCGENKINIVGNIKLEIRYYPIFL